MKNETGGVYRAYGEGRGVYKDLVVKPEGKRPLERLICRLEDNIKMDLREVGCGGVDWIEHKRAIKTPLKQTLR